MVRKDRQNASNASKAEVGEIDTRAPFQSVKDAVSLFGEGAFSGERTSIRKIRPHSGERVLAKETRLHLAEKELNKLKEQLKNAETTKARALVELEKGRRTVDDLTQKLKTLNESKELAIKATEAARNQLKQHQDANGDDPIASNGERKQNLESNREQYANAIAELDTAKQLLRQIHQDCDAAQEAKTAAFKQAADAENAAKANMEKSGELSKEIVAVKESIRQVKLATLHAQQEQEDLFAEKDIQKQVYKVTVQELADKLLSAKSEFDPEVTRALEAQIAEKVAETEAVKKEIVSAKASDLDSVTLVTSHLVDAKKSLNKAVEEESSLRRLLESLGADLENAKREHSELKEKEAETESLAGNLHLQLQKSKISLEAAIAEESKARAAFEEMSSTLHQISSETENAKQEAEEMKKKAEDLQKEAEAIRNSLEEVEKKLKVALEEAKQAKEAEKRALDEIKVLSEKTNAERVSTSEYGSKITISKEEFEAFSRKVEESEKIAEMKVAAALAQAEAIKASENEALQRLEIAQNEIDEMKAATQVAVKRAEMAEAAKKAVEGELRRRRERDQKKASEAASRILAESGPHQVMSPESSPLHYRAQKRDPPGNNVVVARKLEKANTTLAVSNKKALMPNLSGIFHRKKSHMNAGLPSYLPGENPV